MKPRRRVLFPLAAALTGAAGFLLSLETRADDTGDTMNVPLNQHHTETGLPPRELRLRAIVTRALDDAVSTWSRLMKPRAVEVAAVNVRFVSRLGPTNCYGLYTGDGPAYCSGNQTVFVGTAATNHLMSKFGRQAEAGVTFLIGHEIGHHIQNLEGRFQALSRAIHISPEDAPEYVRRFELQADCLAGVWVHDSPAWAGSDQFRADLLSILSDIGDDKLLEGQAEAFVRRVGLHGTSEQRTRWFLRGAQTGNVGACDTFSITQP